MSKILPFDLELAKNGAQVVTADGDQVKIVNFNLNGSPSYPILGLVTRDLPHATQELYEVWPLSGSYDEVDQVGRQSPLPPDLCLVVDDNFADQRDVEATLEIVRNNYTKALAELEASRHNYQAATLRIKELDQVVEKERRERIRLEQWQKEALETIKGWAQVETYIDQTGKPRELGKDRSAIVLGRLATLAELEDMLKKF